VTTGGKSCCLGGFFNLPHPLNETNAYSVSYSGLGQSKASRHGFPLCYSTDVHMGDFGGGKPYPS